MTPYTLVNIAAVEDSAQRFGLAPGLEARFARGALGSPTVGCARLGGGRLGARPGLVARLTVGTVGPPA